jgi:hypothetical protein
MSGHYLEVLHSQNEEKIRLANEKKQKGIDLENRKLEVKVLARVAETNAGEKLLAEHAAGNDDYWKKEMKKSELKLAYKHLTKNDGKSLKKQQLIEATTEYFITLPANNDSEQEEEQEPLVKQEPLVDQQVKQEEEEAG